jgi:hypothetical protein
MEILCAQKNTVCFQASARYSMKKFLIAAIAASLSACRGGGDDSGSSSNQSSSNDSSFKLKSRPDIALTEAQLKNLRSQSFSALGQTGFESPKHFE